MPVQKRPVGVLFVHGIGNEAQGETLLEYAGSVYNWIENWINTPPPNPSQNSNSVDKRGSISILNVDLRPSDDSPAHAEWLLQVKQSNGETKKSQWLLAESWWADTFPPAGWKQTILWAIQVAPLMVLLHFTTLVRKVLFNNRLNFLLYILSASLIPVYVLLSVILAFLVEVLAVALVILAFLPIPALREFVTNIQFIVSNWVGDIYLRITSPIQRAAMVNKVKRDLKWLSDRCEKVAVVSHSQGAAITYELLREDKPESVQRLVTLGSALKLLKVIESTRSTGIYYVLMFVLDILLPIAAIQILQSGRLWWQDIIKGDVNSFFILSFLLIIGVLAWSVLRLFGERFSALVATNPIAEDNSLGLDTKFKWIDLYASHDPAPNGKLAKDLPEFIESYEVYNHANLVTDHTTYWKNSDEFVAAVFHAINELAEIEFPGLSRDVLTEAKLRRKWRVICLIWGRNLAFLCSFILLWVAAANDHFAKVGTSFMQRLRKVLELLPFTDSIGDTVKQLEKSNAAITAAGGILLLTLPLLWYLLVKSVWRLWESSDSAKLFRGETRIGGEYDFGGFPFILLVILASALFLGTGLYAAARNQFFLDQLLLIWRHGGLITFSLFWIFIFSLMVIGLFFSKSYTKEKAYSPAIRVTVIAAPIITWLIVYSNTWSPSVCLGTWLLLLIGLVVPYDRFIGSRLQVGSRLGGWLTRFKSSALTENPTSDANIKKLGKVALGTAHLFQAAIIVFMGSVGLWFSIEFLARWGEGEFTEGAFVVIAICLYVELRLLDFVDKEFTPRWLKILAWLGIAAVSLGCLLLSVKAFLPT